MASFKVTGLAAFFVILMWLAFWGSVIAVAIHFIRKVW